MKNLLSNNASMTGNSFAKFQTASIPKTALKQVKGGEDIIIQESADS